MCFAKFSDYFKRDAVAQITEEGSPAVEVLGRLSVSQQSLQTMRKKFSTAFGAGDTDQTTKIGRLKQELAQVT